MNTVGFEVKKKRTPPKKDAAQKDEGKAVATGDAANDGKDAAQKDEDDDDA